MFANGRSVHADKLVSGVVTKSTDSVLAVAFEEVPETVNLTSFNDSLQLVKLANDVTYRRLKRYAMEISGVLFTSPALSPEYHNI